MCHPFSGLATSMQFHFLFYRLPFSFANSQLSFQKLSSSPLHFSGSFILRCLCRNGGRMLISHLIHLMTMTLLSYFVCMDDECQLLYLKKCQEYIYSFTCTKRSYFCRPVQLAIIYPSRLDFDDGRKHEEDEATDTSLTLVT